LSSEDFYHLHKKNFWRVSKASAVMANVVSILEGGYDLTGSAR
jgi:hypothetical protein